MNINTILGIVKNPSTPGINVGADPEREDIGMHCVQSFLQVTLLMIFHLLGTYIE